MPEYVVPAGFGAGELTEKRSRFIGQLWSAATEEEARRRIEAVKKEHRDARHNCWCYRLSGGLERYSDDGEPQGTAGVPMLSLFQKAGVTNAVCVVTRYFGGVLLGAGGLVRAYTQAAQLALDAAGLARVEPWDRLLLPCPYDFLEPVKLLTQQHRGLVEDAQYGAEVTLTLLFPPGEAQPFQDDLTERAAGGLTAQGAGTVERAAPV